MHGRTSIIKLISLSDVSTNDFWKQLISLKWPLSSKVPRNMDYKEIILLKKSMLNKKNVQTWLQIGWQHSHRPVRNHGTGKYLVNEKEFNMNFSRNLGPWRHKLHLNSSLYFWHMYLGAHLNIKMLSYQYRDPHVKDKTVSQPSYL